MKSYSLFRHTKHWGIDGPKYLKSLKEGNILFTLSYYLYILRKTHTFHIGPITPLRIIFTQV